MAIENIWWVTVDGEPNYPTIVPPGKYFCYRKGCRGFHVYHANHELEPCPKCKGLVFFTQ